MKKNDTYLLLSIFFFLISNIFVQNAHATLNSGDHATPLFVQNFSVSGQDTEPRGITFNNDGTKMYVTGTSNNKIFEYTLTSAFDISTATYRGLFNFNGNSFSVKFNNDGTKMFTISYWNTGAAVKEFLLSTPFDITSISGDGTTPETTFNFKPHDNKPFGLDFNNDGTKMFVTGNDGDDINEFSLNVGFDFSEGVNFVQSKDLTHPMSLATDEDEPFGIEFNQDGTTMFVIGAKGNDVNQYSLSTAFDISTLSFVGGLHVNAQEGNPSGIAFSTSGLKMFILGDHGDEVNEYHLRCPYNLFAGKCPSITKGDRTGIAEAQIQVANRTIVHATDKTLNRLKWIRRNKDLQDLSYQNIKLNFSNEMLASLSEAIQISTKAKEKEKNKDIFYWTEGSLAFGKVRETDASSQKKIYTDSITIGADKFTVGDGIKGLAFKFSQNDVSVGNAGSKLDADAYNFMYYSTTAVKDDARFLDTILGVGALKYNISSVLDGLKLNGNRNGRQIYGTLKLKEEIKKDELTLIPAAQIDLGYTLLSSYSESGKTAMRFDKQSIQSRNLRLSIASVEELNNKKYKMKRHGKFEYQANLHRSSNIKYSYISDSSSGKFDSELNSGALHNINGEVGVDFIYDNNFSLFFIYEHNKALGVGHTHKIHLAIGYLPQKNSNFTFKIEGTDILKSKYIYTKNVNGLDIDFYLLNNNAMRPDTFNEIALNLRKVF